MNSELKARLDVEEARKTLRNWRTCPLTELQDASHIIDGGAILLAMRYAGRHQVPLYAGPTSPHGVS